MLKRRLEAAEAVLGADYQRSLFSGGAIGQNAMREDDVIRVPWEEVRTNTRDVGRIISRVVQQGGEACAQISVKYRGKYLPVFINFHFLFERRGGGGLSEDADEERNRRRRAARLEAAAAKGDKYAPTAGRDGALDSWPLDAYTMVFPSRSIALAYSRWHDWKGDPASAGHTHVIVKCFKEEETRCASERDYLAAIRCRAARALVAQERAGRVANLASTLMGVPMLTQGLQDSNAMLQHLVGLQDAPEDLLIKLDTRSARSALLEYLDDTERVLTSPSLSYYLGANRVMVKNLTGYSRGGRARGRRARRGRAGASARSQHVARGERDVHLARSVPRRRRAGRRDETPKAVARRTRRGARRGKGKETAARAEAPRARARAEVSRARVDGTDGDVVVVMSRKAREKVPCTIGVTQTKGDGGHSSQKIVRLSSKETSKTKTKTSENENAQKLTASVRRRRRARPCTPPALEHTP
jgi:hypothetical protein